MTASLHILCGPAWSGKSSRLFERCRAIRESPVGATLWLVHTRRCAQALQNQIADGPGGSWAPNRLTFQDFADEVIRCSDPSAQPLADAQRRLLLDEIVAGLSSAGQLSHFQR